MRSDAIPGLKLKNIAKQPDGRHKIILYAESVGNSVRTYTTLECTKAIDTYLAERVREGEALNVKSLLIRKEFSEESANDANQKLEKVS